MSSFFGTPSPVERKVDAATNEVHAEVPLELYLEIAEEIHRSQDAGAAHLKAIRKRLTSKSSHVQFLTLSLLDVAVKNGGDAFHETVSSPDFLSSLSTVATTTKFPHIRDQCLSLIQTWAKAFPSQGLHSFAETYSRLRNKGVPFPDDAAGGVVFTPPINLTVIAARNAGTKGGGPDRSPGRSPGRSPKEEKEPGGVGGGGGGGGGGGERHPLSWASPQYVQKVKGESVQVFEYLQLFKDLIASSSPPSSIRSNESIQSLHATLLDARNRVSHLLVELEEEVLMDVMIQVSEAIRLTLEYYNARLKGENVQPPVIDLPVVLRQGGEVGGAPKSKGREAKEGKEGKEEGGEHSSRQQAPASQMQQSRASDPFAGKGGAGAPTAPTTSAGSAGGEKEEVSLDQFDPLA